MLLMLTLTCVATAQEKPTIEIEWSDGPKLPMPLGGHSAVVMEEKILFAGGSNWPEGTKVWREEIFEFDAAARQWRQAAKLPMGLTLSAAAVVKERELLLLGGWYESHTTGDSFRYAKGKAQRDEALDLPEPRAQAGAAVVNGKIYVVGGMSDGADFKTAISTLIRYDGATWRQGSPLPKPLALSSTVAVGDRIYVFGGMGPVRGTPTDSADAYRYDAKRNMWSGVQPMPAARRGAGAVVLEHRYVLLIGGCRNDSGDLPVMLNDVLAYDTIEDRYHVCTPLPFSALCIAAVVKDGQVWAIGGEDLPRHRTDRVVIGQVKLPGK